MNPGIQPFAQQQGAQTRRHEAILEEQIDLTLDDLCRACAAQSALIVELVEEDVIVPNGTAQETWRFTGLHLRRARVAVRLHRDLGVNPAGAALALQLMDEIENLHARLQRSGG